MYTKNEYYWTVPNIENSYFAGFIAADGCLYERPKGNSKQLLIKIVESDRQILERFIKAIQYTGQLKQVIPKEYTYKNGYSFIGKSQSMLGVYKADQYFEDLKKWYNLNPRKSLTLEPPNLTNIELIKAYIIGYIDGDGCIGTVSNKSHRKRITIKGTKIFLEWVKAMLAVNGGSIYCSGNIYTLDYQNNNADAVYSQLVTMDVPRLERKWNYA
jgi:hypothetical protein